MFENASQEVITGAGMKKNLLIAACCFLSAVVNLLVAVPLRAQEPPAALTASEEQFFENDVRPLLAAHCWKCHGPKKVEGGLRLDSLGAARQGGDSGPAVVGGDIAESLLVEAIEYESFEMPPDGQLKKAEIAILKRWISIGAPWPLSDNVAKTAHGKSGKSEKRIAIRQAADQHWAFQPVVKPIVPVDDSQGWARNEIDRFIWKRLAENELRPSPRADRTTLMRRVYFDLIGMPPTPKEAQRFLSDDSEQAFANLVDRLLEDPRYGERWGRHWLDVARYADSKGAIFGEPRDYPYAYTYRDYVISAFNHDLPFDQFLREQIAADQLTSRMDDPSLAALGFLTVHRRANGGAQEAQWVDRVDTVTRGLLGLTVACARCHDHKYDPIPTADFYSLLGVFAGIEEPKELPIIGQPQPGSPLAKEYRAFVIEENRKRQEFITTNHKKILKQFRGDIGKYLLAVHDGRELDDEKIGVLAGRRKLNPLVVLRWKTFLESRSDDDVFAAWRAFAEIPPEKFSQQASSLAEQIASNNLPGQTINPLVATAFQKPTGQKLKQKQKITSLQDVAEIYQNLFDAIDAQWRKQKKSAAENAPATKFNDPQREQLRLCLYGADAPGVMPAGNFKMLNRQAYLRLLNVEADRKLRLALHPGSPRRAMVVHDTTKPYQPYVFLRGNKDRRGPDVPRRFLEVLSGADRQPFQHGSGRRELADAIASPTNPLTARVIVNRVWLWRFGKGLVTTPSDFGLRSDPPSHPLLLDWLAATFVEDGWSIKTLHRRIANSAAYQQSSHGDAEKFASDPDNRLLWRYNRRRVDYETMHDSMLSVSGKLDPAHGGPAVQMIRDAGWAKLSNAQNNWTFNPYRRAVYGVVDRDKLPPLLLTFDFASPDESTAVRDITTAPTQSLYLLNNAFVMELAAAMIKRHDVSKLRDPARRIQRIYELAFNRPPSKGELAAGLRFIAAGARSEPSAVSIASAAVSPWKFGYAVYDSKQGSHELSVIKPFPFQGPSVMQGGAAYPDKKGFGWLRLTPKGGHAAGGGRCLVRRWTSPIAGTVTIGGVLKHNAEQGDGVQATIYGPAGRLGQWSAHNGAADAKVAQVKVQVGDTLDFVIDEKGDGGYDGFSWAPVVRETLAGGGMTGGGKVWRSSDAFPKPRVKKQPASYDAWERYAQVLLMSNEFVFVE